MLSHLTTSVNHEEIEGKVAAARLPCSARMDRLRSMFGSRAFIFAGEKIGLHLDRLAVDRDGAVEDERLSRVLLSRLSERV